MIAKRAVLSLAGRFGLAFLLALVWFLPAPRPAKANVITVSTVDDSGPGSLRWAIEAANNNPGPDTIVFDLGMSSRQGYDASTGTWTINLDSPLPSLTGGQTTIDGGTQTAQTGDTNPKGPEVIVSGANLLGVDIILWVQSGGNTISGLAFTGTASGGQTRPYAAILLDASGNTIADNYIGLHPYYWTARPIGHGIFVGAGSNEIRNNTVVASEVDGIYLYPGGSNWVHLNKIGVDPAYQALGNGGNGIVVWSSPGNIIEGNTISGNSQNGVSIVSASGNSVRNNYIGLGGSGRRSGVGNGGNGILIEGGAGNNTVSGNMIAGNSQNGVLIAGAGTDGNVLQSNYIGGNPEQYGLLIPNGWHGIGIYDAAANNVVGDSANAALGNTIVGSGWGGVAIYQSSYNTVARNNIGTDWGGQINLGNGFHGVAVVEGVGNTIGPGNRIAYNGLATFSDGVRIDGGAFALSAPYNRITRNSIYGNGGQGIMLVNNGNNQQAAPYISEASCGYVRGSASAGSTVEIFSDMDDQGRIYEGSTTANPNFEWTGILHGPNVSATADIMGNTSQFSVRQAVCQLYQRVYLPLVVKNY